VEEAGALVVGATVALVDTTRPEVAMEVEMVRKALP